MAKVKFPSIREVARDLREINGDVEGECDVRLQVMDNGWWTIQRGDSSYDQDHRGYWGASSVPGNGRRFKSTDIARNLIDQAQDQAAQNGETN